MLKEDRRRHSVSLFATLNWWPHVARPWSYHRSRVSSEAMDSRPHLSRTPSGGLGQGVLAHTDFQQSSHSLPHAAALSRSLTVGVCIHEHTRVNKHTTWQPALHMDGIHTNCIMQTCRLIGVQHWLPLDLQYTLAVWIMLFMKGEVPFFTKMMNWHFFGCNQLLKQFYFGWLCKRR